jgi:hypothetical protein
MTFELDEPTAARQSAARRVAAAIVAPAAAAFDRDLALPGDVVSGVRAVLAPAADALGWVAGIEAIAGASVSVALASAGEALGRSALTSEPQWTGCRGLDLDGLTTALSGRASWHLAVSAALIGAAAAAVRAAVDALKGEPASDGPTVAVPEVADAAAAVDAARLLLWEAARHAASDGAPALPRHVARVQALDAVRAAFAAAERAAGPEAFRPGAGLERIQRDAATVAMVAGDLAAEREAVASGTLPE